MKPIHIALSTANIEASVEDYSNRLGSQPVLIIPEEYALWRTPVVNLSIRQDASVPSGQLRHLGWEESEVSKFTESIDVNGITWESFTAEQQAQEINDIWPNSGYKAS